VCWSCGEPETRWQTCERHMRVSKKARMVTEKWQVDRRGSHLSGNMWVSAEKGEHQRAHSGPPPRAVITEKADPSLVTQGWVSDKPWLMTVDTGAFITVARPDVTAGWPKRKPNHRYTLQTVSGEALPIFKEAFLTPWGGAHWKFMYLSRISHTRSSCGWTSCMHMMHLWT
jgi:hypothetical protein